MASDVMTALHAYQ